MYGFAVRFHESAARQDVRQGHPEPAGEVAVAMPRILDIGRNAPAALRIGSDFGRAVRQGVASFGGERNSF
jgi:hypothetical protein